MHRLSAYATPGTYGYCRAHTGNKKSLRLPAWHPTPRALPRLLAPATSLSCAASTIGRNQNRSRWIRSLGGRTDRIHPCGASQATHLPPPRPSPAPPPPSASCGPSASWTPPCSATCTWPSSPRPAAAAPTACGSRCPRAPALTWQRQGRRRGGWVSQRRLRRRWGAWRRGAGGKGRGRRAGRTP